MILVDTNVWSETTQPDPAPQVLTWLLEHRDLLAISSITVGELLLGLTLMPDGRRRDELAERVERLIANSRGRAYSYDEAAARSFARIAADRRAAGRRVAKPEDAVIAAIAHANGLSVATRNTGDFEDMGVDLIDPWGQ
ncbi:PIN domain-containing protein [Nocardioides pelophilus]|uniref:PIN domain-containing protein n=1 Tax=Nocardioides pelophilus TaxID=2172019 RepID=UPI00160068CF|nr:PIN domain-containing protein [Nocardioides pelophilus]